MYAGTAGGILPAYQQFDAGGLAMIAPTGKQDAFCPECGEARVPGGRFCMGCGHTYQQAGPSSAPAKRTGLSRFGRMNVRGDRSDLFYVILASLLALVLSHLPFLEVVVYPFKLFGTFVHEWAHAVIAIATGGHVVELQINSDLSGETFTRGGWLLPIFSAGYTGAAIFGALLLIAPTRFSNRILIGLGGASILMPLIGWVSFGTSFPVSTWIWAVVFGGVSLLVGLRATPRIARLFHQFIAVEVCFTTLDSIRYLIWLSFNNTRIHSDATNAASYTGLPASFWSIVWSVVAVAAIGLAAWRVTRRSLV
jgi:peptidase M50B-like protein